jgi:hypothetical protein
MATDYIVFIHGVKNSDEYKFKKNAEILFMSIKKAMGNTEKTLKPVYVYWGDIHVKSTDSLLNSLQASSQWKQLWFSKLRTDEIIPFVGDAASYLSRYLSSELVKRIAKNLKEGLHLSEDLIPTDKDDRHHLVTHSWGTVILFDILFASRWEAESVDYETRRIIGSIRKGAFSVKKEQKFGVPLASLHTMGSPIALFNLINIAGESSFDLSVNLRNYLSSLYELRGGKPISWNNFLHPGDPIAYPLEGLIPELLGDAKSKVQVEDVIIHNRSSLFNQTLIPIFGGGQAHGSYWTNTVVSRKIAQVIQNTY